MSQLFTVTTEGVFKSYKFYTNDRHLYPVVRWLQESPWVCHLEDLIIVF